MAAAETESLEVPEERRFGEGGEANAATMETAYGRGIGRLVVP